MSIEKPIEIVPQGSVRPLAKSLKRSATSLSFKKKTSLKRSTESEKKKKTWKFKKSELTKLDDIFSAKIRTRDGKCQFPKCEVSDIKKLQCSHYEGRARWETRFDEENCIALCWFHHYKSKLLGWEYQKQRKEKHGWDGQYTIFMKSWLGEARFEALVNRPKQTRKIVMQEQSIKLGITCEYVDNVH